MARLSRPIEVLIGENAVDSIIATVDAVIVGSGYGGSFAAARLAGPGRDVIILERGREYALGDFPADLDQAPRHMRFSRPGDGAPIGYADALFDLHLGEDMDVLVGSGVGGTSLINANVAIQPEAAVFDHPEWPAAIRKEAAEGKLTAHFDAAAELLGVSTYAQGAKHEAFKRLAGELGAPCKPAPIAVTTRAGLNKVGIQQAACTGCGNCVSGCNVGAKNTLAMNVLPLAHARGAAIYSGATVLSVQPAPGDTKHPWRVRLRRTLAEKTPHEGEVFVISARKVVLSAGTLGSTEILLRSRPHMALSGTLGTRFSGNGDALAFSFGQDRPVEALGQRNFLRPDVAVGPTITAIASPSPRQAGFATMEDGAVPHAMLRAFEEIVTTAAQLNRLVDRELPAWHRNNPRADPLSLTDGAHRSAQVLLLMGDDGGNGKLELRKFGPDSDRSRVELKWPDAGKNRLFEQGNDWMAREDRDAGFDGGQFVPNPLWQAVPKQAAGAMSGEAPGGRVLTVHPLGGCPMGEDAHNGVVDHLGRVFDPQSKKGLGAVHDGLYVLDGSIVPRALGINPFLTIAALAIRAADRAAGAWPKSATVKVDPGQAGMYPAPSRLPGPRVPVHFALRERLIGTVKSAPEWLRALHPEPEKVDRWLDDKGFVLDLRMDVRDLEKWLRNPSAPFEVVGQQTCLYSNAVPASVTRRTQAWHTPAEHLPDENIVARADGGTIRLLVPDDRRSFSRTLEAFRTYGARRVSSFSFDVSDLLLWPLLKKAMGFLSIARMHATYRVLEYSIDFKAVKDHTRFRLTGRKVLAWRRFEEADGPETPMRRLVDALLELPIRLNKLDGTKPLPGDEVRGEIEVDGKYLAGAGAPQVVAPEGGPHPSLPSAVAAVAGFGLFFLRSIFQTHFWEFGAPKYPDSPIRPEHASPPLRVAGGGVVAGEASYFDVPLKANRPAPSPDPVRPEDFTPASTETIRLRLVRYRRPDEGAPPALLVHGLAQGSTIYTRDMLERNMASYLWDQGYEVWVLDYRLSHLLDTPVPQGGWAMDELGCFDIPEAVRIVHAASNQQVRLFAHCLGATATTMGILTGRIPQGLLHCVAFNAVHPWIMPSAVNEVRAMVGSFFRDVLGTEPLDPIPSPGPAASQVVLDRLAHAVSRYGELEGDPHLNKASRELQNAVCDRMSLLYGRMWSHRNLDERTHEAFTTLMGPAPGEVYRHLYYFSTHKRLTDREGLNLYLTDANLERWTVPTLFMHGEDSMVFNPHSAERSAIRLHEIVNSTANVQRRRYAVPIGARKFERYGHMDVVFAKDAAEPGRSFPLLRDFFDDPRMASGLLPRKDESESHMYSVDGLTTGPILRAAWVQGNRMLVRLWGEHAEEVTSLVLGLEIKSSELVAPGPSTPVADAENRYHFIDARIETPAKSVRFTLKGKLGGSGIGTQDSIYQVAYRPPRKARESCFEEDLGWLRRLRAAAQGGTPDDMRFLVASCRYPGTPFEHERADAVFAGMLNHARGPDGAHMQFLIGDQIYADATANLLDATFWRERYSEQYRAAFSSANFQALLQRLPTHFTVDDHEFRDNWSGDPPPPPIIESPRNARVAQDSTFARKAARSFMTSGRDQVAVGASRGTPFWYPLDHVAELCRPTFLMDSRSERELRLHGKGTAPRMIDDEQMRALEAWLDQNARVEGPKFIVASTGIGPVARAYRPEAWRNEDGWLGYPATCARILEMIATREVRDVVIVSGDLHLSAASRIGVTVGNHTATVFELVSSGLYAPMPFANAQPDDFDWGKPQSVKLPPSVMSTMSLQVESCLLYQGDPHFMRVDVTRVGGGSCLEVKVLDSAGAPVEQGPNVPAWLARRGQGHWRLGTSTCPASPAMQQRAGGVPATR